MKIIQIDNQYVIGNERIYALTPKIEKADWYYSDIASAFAHRLQQELAEPVIIRDLATALLQSQVRHG